MVWGVNDVVVCHGWCGLHNAEPFVLNPTLYTHCGTEFHNMDKDNEEDMNPCQTRTTAAVLTMSNLTP